MLEEIHQDLVLLNLVLLFNFIGLLCIGLAIIMK